jgi:hypothetical protein
MIPACRGRPAEIFFRVTIDGRPTTLKDAAAFTAQYNRIVTPTIADAIATRNART